MSFYPRSATVRAAEDCTRCSRCSATCSTSCSAARPSAKSWRRSTARTIDRHPPAERAALRRAPARREACSASSSTSCGNKVATAPLRARRGDLPPGRLGRRWLLPGPDRLRQGLADPPRRRARAQLRRPGRLLRRDRPALGPPRDPRGLPRPAFGPPPARRSTTSTWSGSPPRTSATSSTASPRAAAAADRRGRCGRSRTTGSPRRTCRRSSLGSFLDQGLMNAQSLLVLDLEKCTRCDECTKACADTHSGGDAADPRGPAVRQVPGRQLVPLVPRPVLHGRLPGRLDPPARTRARSSSRTGASAAACAPRTAPTATSTCTRSRPASSTPTRPAGWSPSCSRRRRPATSAATSAPTPSRAASTPARTTPPTG